MASPYRRTKRKRNQKRGKIGKERKRRIRSKGSTPSLKKLLGPVQS
ncbi:MAG: hypothetical protein V1798_06255 [Pseudomonadota bacterium]